MEYASGGDLQRKIKTQQSIKYVQLIAFYSIVFHLKRILFGTT